MKTAAHPGGHHARGQDQAALAVEHRSAADAVRSVTAPAAWRTLRLYAGDWAHFQYHCVQHGMKALPASTELVAAFLADPGVGRAALARRLAAIDHQHRQCGFLLASRRPERPCRSAPGPPCRAARDACGRAERGNAHPDGSCLSRRPRRPGRQRATIAVGRRIGTHRDRGAARPSSCGLPNSGSP